jgi:hypothetical protein
VRLAHTEAMPLVATASPTHRSPIGTLMTKKAARATFQALNDHDLDKFLANFREDAVFVYPGDIPQSGPQSGVPRSADGSPTSSSSSRQFGSRFAASARRIPSI